VLGAYDLLSEGHAVCIGSEKQRHLLAALTLHAGQGVSEDRLVDVLWGDHAPATAGRTLQKYVYRLRGVLGGPMGCRAALRLETRPHAYALVLAHAEVDATRFERLLCEARDRAMSDLRAALSLFDEALVLWRGPAWDEFAERDPFRAEAVRLDSMRVAAMEERADVALQLGRHRELLCDLASMVWAYPLRERPLSQLMLALYRSGRQVEAVRAFQDFRCRLVDETGLQPSPALQQLEEDIVLQKPDLDVDPAKGRPVTAAPFADSHSFRR
jgi:DNA-binding SARP family transcriptional activator